ncbi:hypothetical protein V8E53_011193 [Lactarius tabidus]
MENDPLPGTVTGQPAPSTAANVHVRFSISREDADILRQYLDEFQNSETGGRAAIIQRAMAEVYQRYPPNPLFDKLEAGEKIQKWFYNHYIRPKRQYTKFTRKWSTRNAFFQLNRDEIMVLATDVSGKEPGEPGFLGALQDATTSLLDDLTPEDRQEYADAAVEWTAETPPPHIQSRMASSMHKRIIQDFQRQLFKTCGIRTLVLTAYKGEDEHLNICMDDVEKVIKDGKSFLNFSPDWRDSALWEQWRLFGIQCFSEAVNVDPPASDRAKTINKRIPIVREVGGCPALPSITPSHNYKTKMVQSMLREYCTAHIRFAAGKQGGRISWSGLVSNPTLWIVADCTPDRFEWKDPSKIQIEEVFRLLDHWRARQGMGLDPLIWASTCPLFQDAEKIAKNTRAGQQARALQPPDSDEEVFILPDGDDIDLDSNSSHHNRYEDAPQYSNASSDEQALSADTPGNDNDVDMAMASDSSIPSSDSNTPIPAGYPAPPSPLPQPHRSKGSWYIEVPERQHE